MNQTLLIVYSNLGLGGIPVRIVDIVNDMASSQPNTKIYILLKEDRKFDLRTTITNPLVVLRDFHRWCPFDNAIIFILWVWLFIFNNKPNNILTFISPYALPVLATKILFFWRKTNIIVNEGHYTSTMITSMALPAVQRRGIGFLYPLANTIIVPTLAVMRDLHTSFNIPTSILKKIPNWSRYASDPLSKTKRPYDIIYTGRIEKTKNILSLLTILHKLITTQKPTLSCLLVGEGTDVQQCINFIKSHKLNRNIQILPPTAAISQYLQKTKVFLFNPEKTAEGFPVALLDAMSCGTVVITKQFEGVGEIINDTNGYVVKTDKKMTSCIVNVLNNYSSQQSRIKKAKQLTLRRHSPSNIRQYTRLFTN